MWAIIKLGMLPLLLVSITARDDSVKHQQAGILSGQTLDFGEAHREEHLLDAADASAPHGSISLSSVPVDRESKDANVQSSEEKEEITPWFAARSHRGSKRGHPHL